MVGGTSFEEGRGVCKEDIGESWLLYSVSICATDQSGASSEREGDRELFQGRGHSTTCSNSAWGFEEVAEEVVTKAR